jgi:peptide/nickel transport system ATP-binding protein
MAGTGTAHMRPESETLLRLENLTVEFRGGRGMKVHAVSGISLDLVEGETLGIVGESGCGKSSAGRAIVQLPPPTSGRVVYAGHDLTALRGKALRDLRPQIQMIYQDPISSLNPHHTVADTVSGQLIIWKRGNKKSQLVQVNEMLRSVGLDPETTRDRLPREFSGGQCQRICIARALVLNPKVVICDEPVSALDVSVQAQILNLLADMKHRYALSMIFISHDLAVVKHISDRIVVMYLGKLCEVGAPEGLYQSPAHPYTQALLSAVLIAEPDADWRSPTLLSGELPSPTNPPSGCRFRTRCPRAKERCSVEEPILRPLVSSAERFVACHYPLIEAAAPLPVAGLALA